MGDTERTRQLRVLDTRSELVAAVVEAFYDLIGPLSSEKDEVHIALTGGSVGGEILRAIGDSIRLDEIAWQKIQFWWGDERWLPAGDAERNDHQADIELLDRLISSGRVEDRQIHRFPSSDSGPDLVAAAEIYSKQLKHLAPQGEANPYFDLTFLGVGPDAHIASLFPGLPGIRVRERGAIAVTGSPKPPPERLSLTLSTINDSERIWLCLSGTDKASALSLALAGARIAEVPAAGAHGRLETVFFADLDAASGVPTELLPF